MKLMHGTPTWYHLLAPIKCSILLRNEHIRCTIIMHAFHYRTLCTACQHECTCLHIAWRPAGEYPVQWNPSRPLARESFTFTDGTQVVEGPEPGWMQSMLPGCTDPVEKEKLRRNFQIHKGSGISRSLMNKFRLCIVWLDFMGRYTMQ